MNEQHQSSEGFFTADLDPEELQKILGRIDENLAFRHVLHETSQPREGDRILIQDLPNLEPLIHISDWLKMSSAPLHRTIGLGGLRGFLLRLLNLPIRLFTSPQIEYNRKQREYIGELTNIIHALYTLTGAMRSTLTNLSQSAEPVEPSKWLSQEQNSSYIEHPGDLDPDSEQETRSIR